MTTLVIATRNAHKVEEIRSILGSSYQYLTLKDFPEAPEVVEDANSFAGNATKKAVELARWLGSRVREDGYVLADDSGLEVDVLKGAPGVHSARFAALDTGISGNSPDADNNAKLLRLLRDIPHGERTARFRCVIALTPLTPPTPESASPTCSADERELQTQTFDGTCEGHIGMKQSGKGGFGYDPLFIPAGYEKSFAELGEDVKNRMSHRARALEKLRATGVL